jgi:hypothetical protein
VQRDAHPHRLLRVFSCMASKGTLQCDRAQDGTSRTGEGSRKGSPRTPDLDTAVGCKLLADRGTTGPSRPPIPMLLVRRERFMGVRDQSNDSQFLHCVSPDIAAFELGRLGAAVDGDTHLGGDNP